MIPPSQQTLASPQWSEKLISWIQSFRKKKINKGYKKERKQYWIYADKSKQASDQRNN